MNDWISVEDQKPCESGYYLVSGHGGTQFISLYHGGKWLRQTASKRIDGITHWMSLPEPPKLRGVE